MPRSGLLACALLCLALLGPAVAHADTVPSWVTYHRDAGRSGDDPEGTDPMAPAFAWQSVDLGAPMWSQPLVLGDRVYVATVGDQVYSLDAATGKVVWQASAGTPVPDDKVVCGDIQPTVGIVGTPVIDPAREELFAVADTWDEGTEEIRHVLEGFSLRNGERMLETPVDPPGSEPKKMLERPALNLADGNVVFGFGGNAGDCGTYSGAVVSAPEAGGPAHFWNYEPAPPSIGGAAVWEPSGAAVDGEGHVYMGDGNPNRKGEDFETYDYSDSILELGPGMELLGSFEPPHWKEESTKDEDLGSAGPTLLPGGLLFQAGKSTIGFLVEEAGMAEGAPAVFSAAVCKVLKHEGEGSFGGDAFADGTIYVPCVDGIRALAYEEAGRSFSERWHGPADANGPPIVSSGSVWVIDTGPFLKGGGEKLYGLDPETGEPRYTLTLPSPVVDHFASPSAAGDRLFVATGSSVTAYEIAHYPPEAATQAATGVTETSAILHGAANVNGVPGADCAFEYGLGVAYGSSVPCTTAPAGGEAVAVSATASGLAPGTLYHYRLRVVTAAGQSYGADQTLSTAPAGRTLIGTTIPGTEHPVVEQGRSGVLTATPTPVRLLTRSVTLGRGAILTLKLGCMRPSGSCTGVVSLRTLGKVTVGRHKRVLVLASASFAIPHGRTALVKLRLSSAARALLAHERSLRAQATIAGGEGGEETPVTATLTIRRRG